jgi:hypothetical protein
LLNTDYVQNTSDSGSGSLRATIANASSGDTIEFAFAVIGTITLTSGPLDITENLDIEGPGANSLAISGNGAAQVVSIPGGVTATIAGLTIADGNSDYGGGIYKNACTLRIANCTLSGNASSSVDGNGGCIYNAGTLTIMNSTIADNSGGYFGGGIYNFGALTVSDSTFSGKKALEGGGIANNDAGKVSGGIAPSPIWPITRPRPLP